jgi:hypothetical protein
MNERVNVAAQNHPGGLIDWLGEERALRMKRRKPNERGEGEQQAHLSPGGVNKVEHRNGFRLSFLAPLER